MELTLSCGIIARTSSYSSKMLEQAQQCVLLLHHRSVSFQVSPELLANGVGLPR
jgi:hypothetical protein